MIVNFRVIDLECSGLAPPDAEVIEIGMTDVAFDTESKTCEISETTSLLFRAERGIPPEASGVHHLVDSDVAECPVCTDAILLAAASQGDPFALVAHNRAYEMQFFRPELIGPRRWIDTYKCAKHLLPDAPNHKNSTLPYVLGLKFDRQRAQPPHRAGPDSYITSVILARFLAMASAAQLVEWTKAPIHYPTCPLGKHRGAAWSDIPADYLRWLLGANEMEADIKAAAQAELDRRRNPQQQEAPSGGEETQ